MEPFDTTSLAMGSDQENAHRVCTRTRYYGDDWRKFALSWSRTR